MDTVRHMETTSTPRAERAEVRPQPGAGLLPPSGVARMVRALGCLFTVIWLLIGLLGSPNGKPVVAIVGAAVLAFSAFRVPSVFSRLHASLSRAGAAPLSSAVPTDTNIDLLLYRRVQSFTFLFAVPGIVVGIIGLVSGLVGGLDRFNSSELPWIVVAGIAGLGILLLASIAGGTIGIWVAALLTLIPVAFGSGHHVNALSRPYNRAGALLDLVSLCIVSPLLSMGLWLGLLITLLAQQKPSPSAAAGNRAAGA